MGVIIKILIEELLNSQLSFTTIMRDFPLILTQTIAQGYNIGLLAIEWDLQIRF